MTPPKILQARTREEISGGVVKARKMTGWDREVELTSDENEATHEMHGQRITRGTRVDDGHHRIVIGEKFHLKALPVTTPHDRCHHDRKQLQRRNISRRYRCWPSSRKPRVLPNGAKADGTGGIRRDKQVGKRTHRWHTKKLTPFQDRRKSNHQAKSRWNSRFRRMGWDGERKAHNRSIMRRKKVRPGGTTLVTWWREPIKDSNSLRLHHFLPAHSRRSCNVATNFSCGNRAVWVMELSSTPRKIRTVVGPSH